MRKVLGTLLLTSLLLVALMGISYGITNGVPDGTNHPYVGLLVFDDVPGHPAWRCSGSLLSPTIVLTAGHCTDGAVAARAWFAPDVTTPVNPEYPNSGATSYDGAPHTHPDFCIGCAGGLPGFVINDVGIVVLTEAVPATVVSQYASLPALGAVDLMPNKTQLDLVGYGVQFQISGKGGIPPRLRWTGPRIRMYAPTELVSGRFVHSTDFIRTTMNSSGGSGGTCFGDSGGPILEGGTSTVVAVNSYVTNVNCTGVGYAARVDTDSALEFIGEFFPE